MENTERKHPLAIPLIISNTVLNDDTGCWEWIRCTNKQGYGRTDFHGKQWMAHRLAWFAFRGSIPTGLFVCHHCDNPRCCRPSHLFVGTNSDNMQDMLKKGRDYDFTGEHGPIAKLTWEQVDSIRDRLATKTATITELAAEYGVNYSTIHDIWSGRRWKIA